MQRLDLRYRMSISMTPDSPKIFVFSTQLTYFIMKPTELLSGRSRRGARPKISAADARQEFHNTRVTAGFADGPRG